MHLLVCAAMSHELSKDDLRRPDEFVGFFESKIYQFEARKKQIFWGLIVILIVVGIGLYIQSARTGNDQVAARSYAKVLEKLPTPSQDTVDWKTFLTEIDGFIKDHPNSSMTPSAFLYKGKAQYSLKLYTEALASYQTAATKLKVPYLYLAREGEAITQMQLEHWPEAKTIWTDLIAKEDNPIKDFHMYNLALVQEQAGEKAQSIETLQKLLKDFPESKYAESAKLKVPTKVQQ
jgi:tetratricopeptide (TPR) repeat protein